MSQQDPVNKPQFSDEEIQYHFSNHTTRRYSYQPGEKLSWGLFTVIGPDFRPGMFGIYADGWYLLRCACGNTKRMKSSAISRAIRNEANYIYSCGCTPLPRKSQPTSQLSTRPPLPMSGKIIGRLLVGIWTPGTGWDCTCTVCGASEPVRWSKLLLTVGMRPCPHETDSPIPRTLGSSE